MELSNLTEFKDELLRFDELIQEIKYADESKIDESEMENEMEACTDYQCKICECIALLKDISDASTSAQSPNSNTNPLDITRSLLKQPIAPLPKFSGSENEDLMKFLREFELTTSKYNYPDRDLLLLLRQQTSGRAITLLNALEADKQSFDEAKKLLIAAFASPELHMFNTINRLTKLKLGIQDDPFEFISKVKMLAESVHCLDIKTDDFLQYFAWNNINEKFKAHLVQITAKTRPSFQEIVDNFFVANERYANSLKFEKESNKVKKN